VTDPTVWLARHKATRLPVTAVEIRCDRPKAHLVATVHPIPATGGAAEMGIWRRAARYRRGVAAYLAGPSESQGEWDTIGETAEVVSLDAFSTGGWAQHVTWACRCGLGTLHVNRVVDAAWNWSADRRRTGKIPRPRVVRLDDA